MCLECVQLVFSFCLDLKNENSKAPLGPGPALAGLGCALACGGYREFVFRGSLVCGCFVSGSETENRAPQSLQMDLRVCTSTGANRSGICPAIFLGDLISTHSFLMLEGLLLGLLRGRIIAFVKLADLTQELLSPAPSQHMCLCAWFGVRVFYPSFRDPPFSGPPVRKLHCTCCACTLLQPGSSPGLRTFPLLPVR